MTGNGMGVYWMTGNGMSVCVHVIHSCQLPLARLPHFPPLRPNVVEDYHPHRSGGRRCRADRRAEGAIGG